MAVMIVPNVRPRLVSEYPTRGGTSAMAGLAEAPTWTHWMFLMFSARALGFAYGMFLAARDPARHIHWIQAMIGVAAAPAW